MELTRSSQVGAGVTAVGSRDPHLLEPLADFSPTSSDYGYPRELARNDARHVDRFAAERRRCGQGGRVPCPESLASNIRHLTLDGLAERSAVSRAMLSRIERGESSPTAQLLARICGGLGISVAALFAEASGDEPVARRSAQPVWRDPASGYLRRTVSPSAAVAHAPRGARPLHQSHAAALPLRRRDASRSIETIRPEITIRALAADEAVARLDALAAVLVEAVAHGASVNAGLATDAARSFWRDQVPAIAGGGRRLIVAEDGGRVVGTVVLTFAPQRNAPHRAEVTKMLVPPSHRRRGLGRRLLAAAEAEALAAGRTLLMLDTETGSDGDRLYRGAGWTPVGGIPGFALTTDGRPAEATVFYKRLA